MGSIASDILQSTTKDAAPLAVFRLVTHNRRRDRTGSWITGAPSYVSVACSRQLARHVVASLRRGDPVLVTGRLRVVQGADSRLTKVEIEAVCVAPDLNRVQVRIERAATSAA